MFKDLLNNIQTKYNEKKEENNHLKQLLETTSTFQNLFPLPNLDKEASEYRVSLITNECPDLNKDKAQIISNLIPIDETLLTTIYTKEVKTNQEYYLIPTTKYLWVINPQNYGAYPYNNINCQIIKNNLMSKTILLNNILLEANGTDTKIQNLLSILTNQEIRSKIIQEKTAYLCNIIPTYQKINSSGSGISIDNQSNIVFHTKQWNYKFNIQEIINYEILLDNQVVLSKNSNTSTKITNFQNSCYQISLRITASGNKLFIIPILEANALGSKYQRQDTIFRKNFNFAKSIVDKLNNLK